LGGVVGQVEQVLRVSGYGATTIFAIAADDSLADPPVIVGHESNSAESQRSWRQLSGLWQQRYQFGLVAVILGQRCHFTPVFEARLLCYEEEEFPRSGPDRSPCKESQPEPRLAIGLAASPGPTSTSSTSVAVGTPDAAARRTGPLRLTTTAPGRDLPATSPIVRTPRASSFVGATPDFEHVARHQQPSGLEPAVC